MDFIFDPSLVLYLPLYELDSASFMSKNAYGHTCTVTGALWRPNGRYFDGTDDKIAIASSASKNFADQEKWTAEAWVYAESSSYEYVWGSATHPPSIVLVDATRASFQDDALHLITIGAYQDMWMHFVMTMDTSRNSTIYRDGATVGNVATVNDSAIDFRILGTRATGGLFLKGIIGEARVYNRALTPQEIQNNYLATKWRYR